MEKEENSSPKIKKENLEKKSEKDNSNLKSEQAEDRLSEQNENKTEVLSEKNELSTEDKIKDLEDKLTRAYAEMENQRRRFEKEKDDAFEYGGFALARETLNLIDNLVHSKVSLENDANCFALAEAVLGAGKGNNVVFGVIMGTGVGGGIILNGKIHRGRHFIAGEWGHHVIVENGRECYCSNKGCVEAYISGPALEKRWMELTGEKKRMENIIPLSNNDKYRDILLKWKIEFLNHFGQALANIVNILDPDIIVLGGGLSNIDFLYEDGKQAVYDHVFSDIIDTSIIKNKLGDSAGVFGAALLGEIG